MTKPMRNVGMWILLMAGVSIVCGGWLSGGSVALAARGDDSPNRLRVLTQRISQAELTLTELVTKAQKMTGGTVIKAEYRVGKDLLGVDMKMIVEGKLKRLVLDAQTGEPMRVGRDGDDDDGDDDDDDDDNGDDDDRRGRSDQDRKKGRRH